MAVDSGPDVVNRKAARSCARNAAERNAIVIDRFFNTKQEALAWAKAHPHFMTVRILTPGAKQGKVATAEDPRSSPPNIASNRRVDLGAVERLPSLALCVRGPSPRYQRTCGQRSKQLRLQLTTSRKRLAPAGAMAPST
jgi:hypothetical protein